MELFSSLASFFSSLQLTQWLALTLAVILPTVLFKQKQAIFAANGGTASATIDSPVRLP